MCYQCRICPRVHGPHKHDDRARQRCHLRGNREFVIQRLLEVIDIHAVWKQNNPVCLRRLTRQQRLRHDNREVGPLQSICLQSLDDRGEQRIAGNIRPAGQRTAGGSAVPGRQGNEEGRHWSADPQNRLPDVLLLQHGPDEGSDPSDVQLTCPAELRQRQGERRDDEWVRLHTFDLRP